MAGTAHGSNQLATRFFREELSDDKADKVLTEMPPGSPMLGSLTPGGRDYGPPGPGRRRTGPRDLPWRSWLQDKRPGVKSRKRKKKSALASLMG
jgi:hypothetical protein